MQKKEKEEYASLNDCGEVCPTTLILLLLISICGQLILFVCVFETELFRAALAVLERGRPSLTINN